jgi:hypothetical protein
LVAIAALPPGTAAGPARFYHDWEGTSDMSDDKAKISTGPNDRARNETIAGTGPGIPDDALAPGAELPTPPSDEEVERAARALGVPPRGSDG